MKKLLIVLSLAVLVLAPAAASADESAKIFGNTDLVFTMGYKLWLNNWSSWNTGDGGANIVEFQQGGVANMVPMALLYHNFFTTFNVLFTGDYTFPAYTDRNNSGTLNQTQFKVSRNEVDWNVGYYVVPSRLGFTVGLKSVNQYWKTSSNGGAFGPSANWSYLGPTFGITGGAPIGHGFSLYGNGVGGFLAESHPNEIAGESDTASYEAMEMGLAWKPSTLPMNVTFGYKYQKMATKIDIANTAGNALFANQRGVDLTSGYTLGINAFF